jgi:hypothetical protein
MLSGQSCRGEAADADGAEEMLLLLIVQRRSYCCGGQEAKPVRCCCCRSPAARCWASRSMWGGEAMGEVLAEVPRRGAPRKSEASAWMQTTASGGRRRG